MYGIIVDRLKMGGIKMENEEMLEHTNEAENVDTQATEENVDGGIELTDTQEVENETTPKKEEVKQTLRELLKSNPEYQEEFSEMMKTRLDRQERTFQKELSKYKDTENVLKSTLGASDIAEANKKLREYYENEGIKLPDVYKPGLSSRENEILGKADAQDFIDEGYESMLNEANRLAAKEYKNLNERERVVFNTLADKLNEENARRELLKVGAKEEILNDKDFISFKNKFNSKTPVGDIYNLYLKARDGKPKPVAMGSMKDTTAKKEIKDFYSPDDVNKLTDEEWAKPGVFEKALASMKNWK